MFDFNVSKISNSRLNKSIKNNSEKLTNKTNVNAMYVGIVEDTNDPRGLGRIKVRIPALHGSATNQSFYMPTKQIPWASPAMFGGGTNDMGQYIVPVKGSQVTVTFELDSFNKPMYMGTIPTNTSGKTKKYNDNKKIYDGKKVDIVSNDRIKDLKSSSSTASGAKKGKTLKERNSTGKTVLYKSLKGATVMIDDEDGSENITFMDATGQMLQIGNDSGSALPRRGSKTKPGKSAKTYMSLKNGLGDAVTITKGKVNIKTAGKEEIDLSEGKVKVTTSSDDYLQMEEGDITLTNSGGDKVSLKEGIIQIETETGDIINLEDGKASITTSAGETISMEEGKVEVTSKTNKISMDGTKIEIDNGTGKMSLDGNKASVSNGTSSVNLNGGSATISNGSGTLSFNGGDLLLNGARLWTDAYHPGV